MENAQQVAVELFSVPWNHHIYSVYGSSFYSKLSADLRREIPNSIGLSVSNLRYMKYFYERYRGLFQNHQQPVDALGDKIHQRPVDESPSDDYNAIFSIPWGHHATILGKTKTLGPADEKSAAVLRFGVVSLSN